MTPWLHTLSWLGAALLGFGTSLTWAQATADDTARAKKIVGGSCFLCHGAQGESTSEAFPRLAGQHAEYIAKQLSAFKSGARKSSAMAPMVEKLAPEDMVTVGRYYEAQRLPKEEAKDPQLATVGRYIYQNGNRFSGLPACASCHGPTADGAANLPRLAGQFAGYIQTQLKQFNMRERTNDNAVMHAVAERMTELEMAAVAEYLSSQ
ncbi:MAG: cytochrome c4 [Hydrogenophaga sp.]|uniref:c-type cytochrome n=1 Tax=Hydrogenophaga sp. TaxID=1904254 RepID=UPI001D7BF727|nr:c-type cytochrome [Hydrogenophaga sp.]MBX3610863.1 cytochrome c4 [Hydrogenophaga sp.]